MRQRLYLYVCKRDFEKNMVAFTLPKNSRIDPRRRHAQGDGVLSGQANVMRYVALKGTDQPARAEEAKVRTRPSRLSFKC